MTGSLAFSTAQSRLFNDAVVQSESPLNGCKKSEELSGIVSLKRHDGLLVLLTVTQRNARGYSELRQAMKQ